MDRSKRVILLCGSPRGRGNTAQMLDECARVIQGKGVEARIISLKGMSIQSCQACYSCRETGRCVKDDGLNEIVDELRQAMGFIVASPVYFGTARGDVMAALQRIGLLSRLRDKFLAGMVGGPIAVARRGGHTASIQEMLMFYLINDMIVPGSTYWNMVFGEKPGEALNDKEGMETVKHFSENVANLLNKLSQAKT
jgi:multimeric flavodoxin WrbA